jgi:hypothetical protein
MLRNKKNKKKNDHLEAQVEKDRAENEKIGLPENVRAVFGEEHNPNDG